MTSYRTVSISELTPGSVLVTPVFDEHLFKVLGAGTTVDQYLIDRLRVLGIKEVLVDSSAKSVISHSLTNEQIAANVRSERGVIRSIPVKRCSMCGTNISLETPAPNSKASIWLCKSCGAVYIGRSNGGQEYRGVLRVDPAEKNPFVVTKAPSIPQEYIKRLAKSHAPNQHVGADQRLDKRYDVAVPVVALPLGSDFRVIGEPVQMTTVNLSLGGAALIHTRFIDAPHLALDYTVAGVDLQVVLKVLRVRCLGLAYEIAGEFITQLSQATE